MRKERLYSRGKTDIIEESNLDGCENMPKERLDKVLASQNIGSRKESGALIRRGVVTVNGQVVRQADSKVDPEQDAIAVEGQALHFQRYSYIMMNKPAGVLSAGAGFAPGDRGGPLASGAETSRTFPGRAVGPRYRRAAIDYGRRGFRPSDAGAKEPRL